MSPICPLSRAPIPGDTASCEWKLQSASSGAQFNTTLSIPALPSHFFMASFLINYRQQYAFTWTTVYPTTSHQLLIMDSVSSPVCWLVFMYVHFCTHSKRQPVELVRIQKCFILKKWKHATVIQSSYCRISKLCIWRTGTKMNKNRRRALKH
jgi:hypothetical protein